MYFLKRDDYIQILNKLLEMNFNPQFNKHLNKMINLANLSQDVSCLKIKSMHTKLLKIYKNSFLDKNKVIYRCSASLLSNHDNLNLPWVSCILDIDRDGKPGKIVPCMIDSGSQISVCSYNMFVSLGGDPKNLDRSKAVTISSTTEMKNDCILGVQKIDIFIMLHGKAKDPQFAKTHLNLMVGKKDLDIQSKIILGVDLIHRAQI